MLVQQLAPSGAVYSLAPTLPPAISYKHPTRAADKHLVGLLKHPAVPPPSLLLPPPLPPVSLSASGQSSQERKKGLIGKLIVASKGSEPGYIIRSLQVSPWGVGGRSMGWIVSLGGGKGGGRGMNKGEGVEWEDGAGNDSGVLRGRRGGGEERAAGGVLVWG